ncbi:hypothetical protein FI667_g4688, partial [Globisporangium splendens]
MMKKWSNLARFFIGLLTTRDYFDASVDSVALHCCSRSGVQDAGIGAPPPPPKLDLLAPLACSFFAAGEFESEIAVGRDELDAARSSEGTEQEETSNWGFVDAWCQDAAVLRGCIFDCCGELMLSRAHAAVAVKSTCSLESDGCGDARVRALQSVSKPLRREESMVRLLSSCLAPTTYSSDGTAVMKQSTSWFVRGVPCCVAGRTRDVDSKY